jgi:hypothetical protein
MLPSWWPTLDEIGETYQAVARADRWPAASPGYRGTAYFERQELQRKYAERNEYWDKQVYQYAWRKRKAEEKKAKIAQDKEEMRLRHERERQEMQQQAARDREREEALRERERRRAAYHITVSAGRVWVIDERTGVRLTEPVQITGVWPLYLGVVDDAVVYLHGLHDPSDHRPYIVKRWDVENAGVPHPIKWTDVEPRKPSEPPKPRDQMFPAKPPEPPKVLPPPEDIHWLSESLGAIYAKSSSWSKPMDNEVKVITVSERDYQLHKMPATTALRLQSRLLRIFGSDLIRTLGTLASAQAVAEPAENDRRLRELFQHVYILDRLGDEDLIEVGRMVLPSVFLQGTRIYMGKSDAEIDTKFQGYESDLLIVIGEAVWFNLGPLFQGIRSRLPAGLTTVASPQ